MRRGSRRTGSLRLSPLAGDLIEPRLLAPFLLVQLALANALIEALQGERLRAGAAPALHVLPVEIFLFGHSLALPVGGLAQPRANCRRPCMVPIVRPAAAVTDIWS